MQAPNYDRNRVGEYLGLGAGFAGATLVFTFLGWFLDRRLGTTPLFALIGVFIGGSAGFYSLYRRAMALQERERREKEEKHGSSEP
jgi:F0F1-type ATP synthase assembly protein I